MYQGIYMILQGQMFGQSLYKLIIINTIIFELLHGIDSGSAPSRQST